MVQVVSRNGYHRLRCQDHRLYIDTRPAGHWIPFDLALYVHCRLMAISENGRYIAFMDEEDQTLYVCSFYPQGGLKEIARVPNMNGSAYDSLSWDDTRLALLAFLPAETANTERQAYVTVWAPNAEVLA